MKSGDQGILQRDMWIELGATSRQGSRIALQLEKNQMITRERALSNTRWTYRLFGSIRPVDVDSILDIPCTFCDDIINCEAGGSISALRCDKLTQWLLACDSTRAYRISFSRFW